ncbi:MAG: hypothetical protein K8S55_03050, partial [Phycisphaerae bacterium]|nr:hypothetical protein [Phycisphaerae bacterium]
MANSSNRRELQPTNRRVPNIVGNFASSSNFRYAANCITYELAKTYRLWYLDATMTDQNAPWTVTRLLDWTRDYFERAGVESARLCAEMLLSTCLDCSRMELYARFDYQPKPEELGKFRGWVKQAAEGQPVAYLVGKKEFYSLALKVTPDVLIPRPETELL